MQFCKLHFIFLEAEPTASICDSKMHPQKWFFPWLRMNLHSSLSYFFNLWYLSLDGLSYTGNIKDSPVICVVYLMCYYYQLLRDRHGWSAVPTIPPTALPSGTGLGNHPDNPQSTASLWRVSKKQRKRKKSINHKFETIKWGFRVGAYTFSSLVQSAVQLWEIYPFICCGYAWMHQQHTISILYLFCSSLTSLCGSTELCSQR